MTRLNNLFNAILIGISTVVLIILTYFLHFVYLGSTLSLSGFVFSLVINTLLSVWGIVCLLGLILLSTCLYYNYLRYDTNLRLLGVNFALFIYAGFFVLITGALLLSLTPMDNSIASLNSTTATSITLISDNLSAPQNFTIESSFTFANITENKGDIKSINSSTLNENEGLKILNSSLLGNGLGLIGLAIALFAFGFSHYNKIQTTKVEEELLLRLQNKTYRLKEYQSSLSADQLNNIGMIWVIVAIILFAISILTSQTFLLLDTLKIIVLVMIIDLVGVVIIICAIYKSKKPQAKPRPYTFEEMLQKINDELKLRKE